MVDQDYRTAIAGIFGSAIRGIVLHYPFFQIVGDSGIESAVTASEDINTIRKVRNHKHSNL
ncbi:MAG: hypothetical protein A3J39_00500 [Sulfuricurvum sp. RIFCSPHIGHO2_12_FULL_44_8]|nr:MAG: hypothetical protein A3J39_00500 [Sulfuricurvum sp. RIFCSPHIGHO2_12_FULL_44_8]